MCVCFQGWPFGTGQAVGVLLPGEDCLSCTQQSLCVACDLSRPFCATATCLSGSDIFCLLFFYAPLGAGIVL